MEIKNDNSNNKTNEDGEWTTVEKAKQIDVPGFILATHRAWFKYDGLMYQTTAIEMKTNRSDCAKTKKLMSTYNEQEEELGKFVPFGLDKARMPMVYARIVQEHNQYLKNTEVIPVFGIHCDALTMKVRNNDLDQSIWKNLKEEIGQCPAIKGLEETPSTDKNGKWHFLTTKEKKEDATIFIDTFLPKLYKKLATHDLEAYIFDNFPILR